MKEYPIEIALMGQNRGGGRKQWQVQSYLGNFVARMDLATRYAIFYTCHNKPTAWPDSVEG